MAEYRVPEFTLGQRAGAALQMLNPDGGQGVHRPDDRHSAHADR